MKIAITYNSLKKGIECFFTPVLIEEDALYTKLMTFGFKQAFSNPKKWYVEDKPTFRNYVEGLKKALEANSDPLAVLVQPSYEINESNIDQDLFSSVYITFKTDGKTDTKNYVIFETFKGVAQDIAERYAKQKYGQNLIRVICKPREQRADARRSYLAGKTIGRVEATPDIIEVIDLGKNSEDLKTDVAKEAVIEIVSEQLPVAKSSYKIMQPYSSVSKKIIKKLEKLITSNPQYLLQVHSGGSSKYDPPITRIYIISDKDFIKLESVGVNVLKIYAHFPKDEDLNYVESSINTKKLTKAINYLLLHPDTLKTSNSATIEELKISEIVEESDEETAINSRIASDEIGVAPIPTPEFPIPPSFVFIPEGIPKPFDSGEIYISDRAWIAENFPELYKLNDDNLSTATAQELFMLMQFSHPNEYGIPVLRSTLLKHWEENGKELFEALGYPTNLDALYANCHGGFTSVFRLENLLGNNPDKPHYWAVVARRRPIVDPVAAISYIENLGEIVLDERSQFTNPKTHKPKSNKEDKEAYSSLTWKLENYEEAITLLNTASPKSIIKTTSGTTKARTTPEPIPTPEFQTPPNHVFVPKGISAPFDLGEIKNADKTWIAENHHELFSINDDTLSDATPQQLFMLMQFRHPKNFGITVLRSRLLEHWEHHGEELLEKLGYSTHSDALYANSFGNFTQVARLEDILATNEKPNWERLLSDYRFVKDHTAAIQFLYAERTATQKELDAKDYLKLDVEAAAAYSEELTWKIDTITESITQLKNSIKEKNRATQPLLKETKTTTPLKSYVPSSLVKAYVFFSQEIAVQIRSAIKERRLPMPFTGKQAWEADCTPMELIGRWGTTWDAFEKMYQEPLQFQIQNHKKTLRDLKGKRTKDVRDQRGKLNDLISADKKLLVNIEALVHDEFLVFQDELFEVVLEQTEKWNYQLNADSIADFQEEIMPQLLEDRQIELYANEPIQTLLPKLLKWYFEDAKLPSKRPPPNPFDDERLSPDYMVKTLAIMSNIYMDAKRLTKGKIQNLMEETQTPNLGMLWEAVELSWLMWYKMYYGEWIPFENRLGAMIRFWNKVQPTYAYSDSSKELYKQYSTPCPIGAMIAQYTQMDTAQSIFEPSAGNGLLLVGAKPEKCHVNEIDENRRQSLLHQQFKKITHWNAAEPFPEELTKSFDVMVTNPPFAKWEEDKFDKERIVHKYFDKHRGLEHHLRLEHLMAGLALHTLKDNGKAALIIMGHITFEEDSGYITRYRPFLNWLYRNYRVADIINLNSYKLYNKQGATREVMLILIDGRKNTPSGAAPKFKDAPYLEVIEDNFADLWQRIKSHIKSPLEKLLQQLKIINGHDLF